MVSGCRFEIFISTVMIRRKYQLNRLKKLVANNSWLFKKLYVYCVVCNGLAIKIVHFPLLHLRNIIMFMSEKKTLTFKWLLSIIRFETKEIKPNDLLRYDEWE